MKKAFLFLFFVFLTSNSYAGGLSSNWGEVVIDNLEPGKTYELNKISGAPFTITNNFDNQVTLKLEVLKPQNKELKSGYEPLPDVTWVKLDKQEITIERTKNAIIDLKVTVPNDPQYRGKKYHFWVWSYTSGQAMGVGLKSRILITIMQ